MANLINDVVDLNYSFLHVCLQYELTPLETVLYLALVGWAIVETVKVKEAEPRQMALVSVPQRKLCELLRKDPENFKRSIANCLNHLEQKGLIKKVGKHETKTTIYEVIDYVTLQNQTIPGVTKHYEDQGA